jgi:hypothetical protein
MPQNWRKSIVWILSVNTILLLIDVMLLLILAALYNVDVLTGIRNGYLSTMLFVESGIIFLAGGLVAMTSSIFFGKVKEYVLHSGEKWSAEKQKKSEQKANLYIIAGSLMFLESLVLAAMIF